MKKTTEKTVALVMAAALCITTAAVPVDAKVKKPKLSTKKMTLSTGTKKKLQIKNARQVKKVTWKSKKTSVAFLTKKTKKSVTIVAKKPGKTTVTCQIKAGKKTYKFNCNVTVKKAANPSVTDESNSSTETVAPAVTPAAMVPGTSQPATEKPQETIKPSGTPDAAQSSEPDTTPTVEPSKAPVTAVPTKAPVTVAPTTAPTKTPAVTAKPSAVPTKAPVTAVPTASATVKPTNTPAATATAKPTATPTAKLDLEIDSANFTNRSAYTTAWNGDAYNLGTLLTEKGYTVSDFTDVKITVELLDADKNVISGTSGASVKLSKNPSDWAGFVDVNGVQSNKEFGLQLETYPSGSSDLYLIVQNSTTTVKYIRVISIIMENNGKKDATEVTTNYQSLASLAEQYGFKFGTNISSQALSNTELTKLIKYHFNSTTFSNEMKAYSMLKQFTSQSNYKNEQSTASIDFTTADKMVEYAQANGLQIRGHVLTWDADMCDWFFREGYTTDGDYVSADVMKYRLQKYIEEVMTHFEQKYPGVIYCWDVVNEAVADNTGEFASDDVRHVRTVRSGKTNLFYDHIGKDYVELAFKYAYETRKTLGAEDRIKLFYNDYNTFMTYGANKRDAIVELVKSVNSSVSDGQDGYLKLCDGIGMQSYIGGYGQQSGCMNNSDITLIKNAIEKFASIGVEVHVTELAVRNYERSDEREAEHGAFYKKLMQTYVDINKAAQAKGETGPITSLSIWGLFDAPYLAETDYSYKMNGPYCGLFTELYQPKAAFKEVYNVLSTS